MTAATNVSDWPRSGPYSPPITIILATALLVVFFVGFFSVCLCRCVMENIASTWHLQRTPSGNLVSVACAATRPGLDPSQIQTFPTFAYSTVKDFRKEKYGLECAICLSEFETESMLRLLTVCYHVFHQECIDLWLKSHKTCPVCRRMLDPTDGTFGKASPRIDEQDGNEASQDGAVRIDIRDNDHEHGRNGEEKHGEGGEKAGTSGAENNEICEGKLERSHTTGHSIVRSKKKEDKYTLRLPEHVRRRILRGHNWTGSCITFEDISKNMANETYGESGFSGGTS